MTGDLIPIGRIARLQVQTGHLKRGEQPRRWYDPAPITEVTTLRLDDGGVTGIAADGTVLHDVHHRDHPISRHRGDNGVSVGFTRHYAEMRERFGDEFLPDGIAGENLLVECDEHLTVDAIGGALAIETQSGVVRLAEVMVAAPCVEFTRYCLRWPRDARPDRTVTEALQFLDHGMRGYYARFDLDTSAASELRVGDVVFAGRGSQPAI
jgi:hypothetical protein